MEKKLLSETNKVVIVKSLTKFFAIPGLRLGYALTKNQLLLEELEKVTPPWRINSQTEQVGKAILENQGYIDERIMFIQMENQWLYNQLSAINGMRVLPSKVNFLLCRVENELKIFDLLLEKNILIRKCNPFEGLHDTYFRVAVKSREDNIILVEGIKNIFNK